MNRMGLGSEISGSGRTNFLMAGAGAFFEVRIVIEMISVFPRNDGNFQGLNGVESGIRKAFAPCTLYFHA